MNHTSTSIHLTDTDVKASYTFYPAGTVAHLKDAYGLARIEAWPAELTVFVQTSAQAHAIAAAFGALATDLSIAEVERDNAAAAEREQAETEREAREQAAE